MRKPERTIIDGITYEVAPLGADAGLDLLEDLLRLMGPAMESIPSLTSLKSLSGDAIAGLVANLPRGEVKRVGMILAASTKFTAPGGKLGILSECFALHFAGEYLALADWMRFALEVNYKRFFDGLQERMLAIAKARADAARAASDAPPRDA